MKTIIFSLIALMAMPLATWGQPSIASGTAILTRVATDMTAYWLAGAGIVAGFFAVALIFYWIMKKIKKAIK